jgi:tetratricopeptide (TPR) repeat protein
MTHASAALSKIVLTAATVLSLAGCSLLQPTRSQPTPPVAPIAHATPEAPRVIPAAPATHAAPAASPTPPPTAPAPPLPLREFHLNSATQSLVYQAHAQLARGELPGAATTLDRALRIEPQNPLLWIELAQLRLAENDGRQAESCARKALALGSLDPQTRAKAGHVLAAALRLLHRDAEATELEAQAWMK